jgi:hypothetical protein
MYRQRVRPPQLGVSALERLRRNPPNDRVGSRRLLQVFVCCFRLRPAERLEAAPRERHPLINEEGVLLGDSFRFEKPRAIDQDEAGGADAEGEPVCVAEQTLNVVARQFFGSAVWQFVSARFV